MTNFIIRQAQTKEIDGCIGVLKSSVRHMRSHGLTQWDDQYPNREVLQRDLLSGSLYIALANNTIAGFAAFDQNQPQEYSTIDFQYPLPAMVVHRLCIDPAFQRMGLAYNLMLFAYSLAIREGCRSIRLDTRADNRAALALYEKLGFKIRGHVHFPRCSEYEFPCMEIALN